MTSPTPYADLDTPRRMRGDCRVLAVRISLPDPRDRHLGAARADRAALAPHSPDAGAALLAARLGL